MTKPLIQKNWILLDIKGVKKEIEHSEQHNNE